MMKSILILLGNRTESECRSGCRSFHSGDFLAKPSEFEFDVLLSSDATADSGWISNARTLDVAERSTVANPILSDTAGMIVIRVFSSARDLALVTL